MGQGRVLTEDSGLEFPKDRRGIETGPLSEEHPIGLGTPQGFGGTTTSVESNDQLAPESLPKGVLDDSPLKVSDEPGVHSQLEAGLKELLTGVGTELVEPGGHRYSPFAIVELIKCRTSPQTESTLKLFDGRPGVRGTIRSLAKHLEASGINGVARDLQHVTRRPGDDSRVGAKKSA